MWRRRPDRPSPASVGLQLATVAHESFNVLTKYKFDDGWELGGQATYRSKIYGGTLLAANQGTALPSYWQFDTFVEKKVTANLTAKIFVNNIFNKLYYDGFYQSATPFVFVAPGRVAGLVLNASSKASRGNVLRARDEAGPSPVPVVVPEPGVSMES